MERVYAVEVGQFILRFYGTFASHRLARRDLFHRRLLEDDQLPLRRNNRKKSPPADSETAYADRTFSCSAGRIRST